LGVVQAIPIRCSHRYATAAAFAAKGIIQSPITSCSRRDHSVCYSKRKRNPENSVCRQCCLSLGCVRWESTDAEGRFHGNQFLD